MEYTHSELVEIGYKWTWKRCGFVFKELKTINGFGEIPDIIGFNSGGTFLLEAKTSRSDFFADREKGFRKIPEHGMGDWRFIICKAGMIKIKELQKGWGLIEVGEKGKAGIRYYPFGPGNMYYSWERNKKHDRSEYLMLYSALRRLQIRGVLDLIYDKPESYTN